MQTEKMNEPLEDTPRIRSDSFRRKAKAEPTVVDNDLERHIYEYLGEFPNKGGIIAMRVNGLLQNLNTKLVKKCKITLEPIYLESVEGEGIIRRSLVFLMAMAFDELRQELPRWHVEHQLDNAYFCRFDDDRSPDEELLEKIGEKMKEIAKKDLPISEDTLYYQDAVRYFTDKKLDYTLRLISSVNDYEIPIHVCGDFMLMRHRTLCYSTKYLDKFELHSKPHGWTLSFSFQNTPFGVYFQAKEMGDQRVIEINKERNDFVRDVEVKCVGDINQLVTQGKIENFIQLNNTFQDMVMNSLIKKIDIRRGETGCRLILIAGPSAAGKTTFAKKVGWNLQCRGYRCYTLSVDHYYVMRENNPRDPETGELDFECLQALRIRKLNETLEALFQGKEVWIPHFDMRVGKYDDKGEKMKIEKDSFLIMEGIHCLNDKLTPNIPPEMKYKVFIGPFTPINMDDHNYISNKIIRLIRRAVRDKMHRDHTIHSTLDMWPSVMKGEHLYIFPFMKEADFIFNSALDYEINVLKPYVKPLLKGVKPNSKHFNKAKELLKFLEKFEVIPYKYVPLDSLLQEFLRGHWIN